MSWEGAKKINLQKTLMRVRPACPFWLFVCQSVRTPHFSSLNPLPGFSPLLVCPSSLLCSVMLYRSQIIPAHSHPPHAALSLLFHYPFLSPASSYCTNFNTSLSPQTFFRSSKLMLCISVVDHFYPQPPFTHSFPFLSSHHYYFLPPSPPSLLSHFTP